MKLKLQLCKFNITFAHSSLDIYLQQPILKLWNFTKANRCHVKNYNAQADLADVYTVLF